MSLSRTLLGIAAATGIGVLASAAVAQDTIKLAYIEPLSGPFANVGDAGLKNFQFIVDRINAAGGVLGGQQLEVIGFDNKLNAQEGVVQLQKAIDQGIHFAFQGQSSGIAHAIIDAINKNNARNPDDRILHMNYAAVDPALTNKDCSFWHFRFDANVDIKMDALTTYMVGQPDIKKVYLINQNYSFGQAVEAAAKAMIPAKRPDIEIVGAELHPVARITDFAPYVQKIKASGADTVITGNWGNDIQLLIQAANDAGLDVKWFTYYIGSPGTPRAVGPRNAGKIFQISEWHQNVLSSPKLEAYINDYEAQYHQEFLFYRAKVAVEMLVKAIEAAGTTDPTKVAFALEGMEYEGDLGKVQMRASDHQLFQPMYISEWSNDVKYDVEVPGWGFKTDGLIPAADTVLPTTCQMERPS